MSDASAEYAKDGTLVLAHPVDLPDVLDLLIVGGGPAGTAAAFRAKELNLSALVIEYDDILKKIRDFGKGKEIKPNYGKGDKMKFPLGGDLISLLHFPSMGSDEMCAAWKGYYRECNVPARIGIEFVGMNRVDEVWEVQAYNHNLRADEAYRARHVVLAIGRGVARRFDVPGNTAGISYRLKDPAQFVGAPACVVGGGTSAGEAVIAISNAKAGSNDPSAVYWSYRKDRLPKVSKALAEEFFDAYMGNGNIRYYPNSEPVAIVTVAPDLEYMSLRVDRITMIGRPNETAHLEFPKENCLACIGEDLPEKLLNSVGIHMIVVDGEKKRMLVTPALETEQPNTFLAGDILATRYIQTEQFPSDVAAVEEIRHGGNIKAAITNGFLVAEVVAQKLRGLENIEVDISFADTPPVVSDPVAPSHKDRPDPLRTIEREVKPPEPVSEQAYLAVLSASGTDADEFPLKADGVTTIGRKSCDIVFPEDDLMAERHAAVSHNKDGYFLRDDGSSTGVFLQVPEGRFLEIVPGDLIRLGRQFLLIAQRDGQFVTTHHNFEGHKVGEHVLPGRTVVMGREAPDITLDGEDRVLSRRHASLSVKDGRLLLKDLSSLNGTYLRITREMKLESGDRFRVGQQLFELNVQQETIHDSVHIGTKCLVVRAAPPKGESIDVPKAGGKPTPSVPKPQSDPSPRPEPSPELQPDPSPAPGPVTEGLMVSFEGFKSVPYKEGQSILEIAEEHGIPIKKDCKRGNCAIDPIRIVAGQENCNAVGSNEEEALEDICDLCPGEYRLACVVRPTGPVTVEIIKVD